MFFVVPACVIALAGCSSSSKSSTSSPGTTAKSSGSSPGTTSSSATAVGCSLVYADQVAAILGVHAKAPTAEPNGSVMVCLYPSNSNPRNTTIRYQTGMTAKDFADARAQFDANGEKTTTVKGVGNKAYSSSIGKVNTLVVLKGKNEVLISAPAPLSKIETLAQQILPRL